MSTDMELSCDERVLKLMNEDIKKHYANTLLSLATGKHILNGSPLAFGEGNVKGRIKNVLNYKRPTFWVIAVTLFAVIVVAVGLFTNPIKSKPDDNILTSRLLQNKTEYVGNNSKVGAIISLLTFPKNIVYDSFELFTDSEPFAITVNLKTDTETRNLYSGEANQQQFKDNAIIMFALIGNVEYINFNLDDGLAPYSMQYTREWANYQYGKDVRDFAISKEEFSKLINRLSANGKNMDENEIAKFVEENLAIIMSSPMEASNPYSYIQAHQEEYESIKKLGGEKALQYMLSQFESGNAEGLRGHIMMQLCKELLGVRNNVDDESLTPQEWYNALSIKVENETVSQQEEEDEEQKALQVVKEYFSAFGEADYDKMRTLATENHNHNLVHDGDVWGMKWAKAKQIELIRNPRFLGIESSGQVLVFFVSVDMETVKTSAQYPATQNSFYVVLIKGDDGSWRVDRYATG